jgi:hypothetical protein
VKQYNTPAVLGRMRATSYGRGDFTHLMKSNFR